MTLFDGRHVIVYDDAGSKLGKFESTSGIYGYFFGIFNQDVPGKGPIPEGEYTLDPSKFSKGSWLRNLTGDWGTWRVRIEPKSGTNTYGRKGFYIHGGKKPGTKGCIDLGKNDIKFHNLLKDHAGKVDVKVNYNYPRK